MARIGFWDGEFQTRVDIETFDFGDQVAYHFTRRKEDPTTGEVKRYEAKLSLEWVEKPSGVMTEDPSLVVSHELAKSMNLLTRQLFDKDIVERDKKLIRTVIKEMQAEEEAFHKAKGKDVIAPLTKTKEVISGTNE